MKRIFTLIVFLLSIYSGPALATDSTTYLAKPMSKPIWLDTPKHLKGFVTVPEANRTIFRSQAVTNPLPAFDRPIIDCSRLEMLVKLTDALLGEHGAFYALFEHVEEIASAGGEIAQIQGAITVLETMVLSHATLEEELLFSALEPHLGRDTGPLARMHGEHEEMEILLARIEEAEDIPDAIRWIDRALSSARAHFKKEEEILFPMAQELIGDEALHHLGAEWAKARRVTII